MPVPNKFVILSGGLAVISLIAFVSNRRLKYLRKKEKETAYLKYMEEQHITVHMVSETVYVTKGQGVHTAFIELVKLLRGDKNIAIVLNNEGTGNVFHSHTYGPYYFWKGRSYKGRRVLTAHVIPDSIKGSLPLWRYLMPLARQYFKMVYSYADTIIALSPMVECAIKDLGVKTKVVKIYNPVLTDNWVRTPESRVKGRKLLGIKDNETLVLGVGQLQERKGVEDFIDIGEAIPDARFVWVGGRPFGIFTEGIKRIDSKIEHAAPNINFAGMQELEDMRFLYAAADIFLFPSYQENCPLAPLEAAASGIPVVFRDLNEYKLLYTHPYIKAADTADFIRITTELINNKPYYNDAVKISKNLIKEFDKVKIREEIISLYHDLLSKYFKK
ncbi:MAG: 1,2-diacylglycerol-3-alpha-glucose alpha,2-galactosyltransferase [Mucilaginibacter sp.]|nr:1,2-diacylglycerol-3-alpha-glucose alpha,2-galactosyltransferase [Mucilaginibacter sp.]